MKTIPPFKYAEGKAPKGYECDKCSANGVRLYRKYQTFLNHQSLLCTKCACEDQKKEPTQNDHSIGWLVAAVPTEDGYTFWGFTSVPDSGVIWWNNLPKE